MTNNDNCNLSPLGTGFGTDSSCVEVYQSVYYGTSITDSYQCNIQTLGDTQITCLLDAASIMDPGAVYKLRYGLNSAIQ